MLPHFNQQFIIIKYLIKNKSVVAVAAVVQKLKLIATTIIKITTKAQVMAAIRVLIIICGLQKQTNNNSKELES